MCLIPHVLGSAQHNLGPRIEDLRLGGSHNHLRRLFIDDFGMPLRKVLCVVENRPNLKSYVNL